MEEENENMKKNLILECGTSLAEDQHNFVQTTQQQQQQQQQQQTPKSMSDLIQNLQHDILPHMTEFSSPFQEELPIIYADQTASSQPLNSIESFIQSQILPTYGNTHTNTSHTGSQTTAYIAEARQIIAEECGAHITGKAQQDVVLFAGSGVTSCVSLVLDVLNLNQAPSLVVFVSIMEHHSNLIPWRECGARLVTIGLDDKGRLDLLQLEQQLRTSREAIRIGAFCAMSNVTGQLNPVDQISNLLHAHNALSCFDYATALSYVNVNLNNKDVVYFSPHKLLGGVNTPGVVIMKKKLFTHDNIPKKSGGGTVFYVSSTHHRFLSNRIERYEGGTPDIIGIIRIGLVFLLRRNLRHAYSHLTTLTPSLPKTTWDHDLETYLKLKQRLTNNQNIHLVGINQEQKAPIFSFCIQFQNRFLHYNYVCALLNDLFGIQSRGGCQCSGPYSQVVLGISHAQNIQIEHALLLHKAELLRPGYTRLSLPFKSICCDTVIVDYISFAIEFIAQYGWCFANLYRCNHRTGEWRHKSRQGKIFGKFGRKWLNHYIPFQPMSVNKSFSQEELHSKLANIKNNVYNILKQVLNDKSQGDHYIMEDALVNECEVLRWFVYPQECFDTLKILKKNKEEITLDWIKHNLGNYAIQNRHDVILGPIQPLKLVHSITSYSSSSQQQQQHNDSEIVQRINEKFSFRDGETHAGEASSKEIQQGFEDGELSSKTLIFVVDKDDWILIEEFIALQQKEDQNCNIQKQTIHSFLFSFRDGSHTGQATFEDIQNGFHEGELSTSTQVFNETIDEWINIEKFIEAQENIEDVKQPLQKTSLEEHPYYIKKQSRDCSNWGCRNTSTSNIIEYTEADKMQVDQVNVVEEKDEDIKIETTLTNNLTSGHEIVESYAPMSNNENKKKKQKFHTPPPKMMRQIIQAIIQHDMIENNDRLLLGLSGGKDSLSLLHALLHLQKKLPVSFEIHVCTIDPMTASFDPSPLIPYVTNELGLTYHYIRDDIVSRASTAGGKNSTVKSLCAYCARMKRGNLYTTARKNNCNKLVLAQHLDDCAESLFMSLMHNGMIRTMKSRYTINEGDLTVIRPLIYCREKLMTDFATSKNLPIINENCPACFEEPKERDRVKKLLSREELLYPNLFDNIRRSLIPLFHEDMENILRCYIEEIVSKSRKDESNIARKKKKNNSVSEDDLDKNDAMLQASPSIVVNTIPPSNSDCKIKEKDTLLKDATEEELVKELIKRKSSKYCGTKKKNNAINQEDNNAVCSLDAPCYELMK